ncbi:MAG: hypothetical protein OER88_09835, partial [Planctomycetota bacterium]|nr:hypothetical protein [Planctomycetota bacterium]
MTRPILVSFVLALGIGCGGGTPAANEPAPAEEAPGTATPDPVAAPQMPEVAGEVIGLPGAPVPGLSATYVTTGLGWLGSTEDEVVFEGVIQWTDTTLLGCGILRRAPDGTVHTVLMQDQVLPNTGFGRVKHPRLPLESNETTLLIPAGVEGGTISRGLFAVPKHGGAPVLIAAEATGLFVGAEFTDDGRVIAEVDRDGVRVVLVIEPGADPLALCEGCAPGFSSDGTCVVVHDHDRAERIELDGAAATIVAVGDPAPGSAGSVTAVRDAWTTPSGDLVVHLQTDDAARPDVLIRIRAGQVDLLAACGAPAPGTNGTFDEIRPARGEYDDVVFGATVAGDPESGGAIFCALRGGATEI